MIITTSIWTGCCHPFLCEETGWVFPGGAVVKNPSADVGDAGLIPGLGRSPGEGNGNLLQYSCLGIPMDRGAWRATVPGGCKRFGHDLVSKQQQIHT